MPAQAVQQRGDADGASRAQWMTQRNGATQRVDFGAIQPQIVDYRKTLRGKGFIQFDPVDSILFYPIAFLGTWSNDKVLAVMFVNWFLKVLWEILLTPVTYAVVGWLKRREGVDVFDEGIDFSPFAKTKAV